MNCRNGVATVSLFAIVKLIGFSFCLPLPRFTRPRFERTNLPSLYLTCYSSLVQGVPKISHCSMHRHAMCICVNDMLIFSQRKFNQTLSTHLFKFQHFTDQVSLIDILRRGKKKCFSYLNNIKRTRVRRLFCSVRFNSRRSFHPRFINRPLSRKARPR